MPVPKRSLSTNGYLGPEGDAWALEHRGRHADQFTHAELVNYRVYELLARLHVDSESGVHVVSSVLLVRALELYQAALAVLQRDIAAPAKVVLRALLEVTFTLRAINSSQRILDLYILQHDRLRLKRVNKAQNSGSPNIAELRAAATDEFKAELKKAIESEGTTQLTTEDLARAAGLHDYYLTIYEVFTSTAHVHAVDLQQYIHLNAEGKFDSFRLNSPEDETGKHIGVATDLILKCANAVASAFELNEEEQWAELAQEAFQLAEPHLEVGGDVA